MFKLDAQLFAPMVIYIYSKLEHLAETAVTSILLYVDSCMVLHVSKTSEKCISPEQP